MKLLSKSIIALSTLFFFSSCDKVVNILKNPSVPKPPVSQLDFVKVGAFSAYADGSFQEDPNANTNNQTLYYSQGAMALFGIDKDGKVVQMKDENGVILENRVMGFSKPVKSGLIFSAFRTDVELVEMYFTEDGKTAKKIGEGNQPYRSFDDSGFSIPEKSDYEYFCAQNSTILKWDDKRKTLSEVFTDRIFNNCEISKSGGSNFLKTDTYNLTTNRREFSLMQIKTDVQGVSSLESIKDISASVFSYYSFSKIVKIKNDVFFVQYLSDMIGYVVDLRKINLESKQETVVKDFTMEESNSNRDISFLFNGNPIDNKIYIEANFYVDLETNVEMPIYGQEGTASNFWTQSQKRVYKLFTLSTEDGTLSESFRDEGIFVGYSTVRSGDIVHILKYSNYAFPILDSYDSANQLEVMNIQKQVIKTYAPMPNVSFYQMSLSNASLIMINDRRNMGDTVKIVIPPAIIGGEFLETEVLNSLNAHHEMDFISYYDEIMFRFQRTDSNVSELGILKRDGTAQIFEQKNATIGGKFAR